MKITIASQKGGVGKSTIAINIALALAGLPDHPAVALVDTDEQRSVGEVMHGNHRDNLTIYEAPTEPHKTVLDLKERFVIIDTPPHTTDTMRLCVAASDMVIVPVQPSPLDIRGIAQTVKNISFIQEKRTEAGKPLHCRILLNRVKPNTKLSDSVRSVLGKLYPFPVFQSELHDREAYKQAVGQGRSVIEHDKSGAAAQELGKLIIEVVQTIKDIS